MRPFITFDGVSKSYGSCHPLIDSSFSIARGDAFFVHGERGAGHSTLANLVTGFTTPTAGTIRIDGLDPALYRRRYGVGYASTTRAAIVAPAGGAVPRPEGRRARLVLDRRSGGPPAGPGATDAHPRSTADTGGGATHAPRLRPHRREFADRALDAPYVGLDLSWRPTINGIIRELAASGAAVVVVGKDIATLMSATHRRVWLEDGKISSPALQRKPWPQPTRPREWGVDRKWSLEHDGARPEDFTPDGPWSSYDDVDRWDKP